MARRPAQLGCLQIRGGASLRARTVSQDGRAHDPESLSRAQYIGAADPDSFDEFYKALKRKADLKRTAVIDTEVDRLVIVLN